MAKKKDSLEEFAFLNQIDETFPTEKREDKTESGVERSKTQLL